MEEKETKIASSIRTIFSRKFPNNILLPITIRSDIFSVFRLKKEFIQHHYDSRTKNSAGFTLVELLIVISLIGIFATGFITIMDPGGQLRRSRDATRKSDLRKIQAALELYRSDCSSYPPQTPSPLSGSSFVGTCNGTTVTYLQTVPKDPKTKAAYTYIVLPGGGYRVSACIENASDPERVSSGCSSGYEIRYQNP